MVSIQVTRRYNRAESTILGLVSLREGLEVAGSVGSCVSALFQSQVRSGGSGSCRVGRFVHFGVVPVAGSLGGVSSASGTSLLAFGCAQMLWVLCGANSARCDDVVGLGSRWVTCSCS